MPEGISDQHRDERLTELVRRPGYVLVHDPRIPVYNPFNVILMPEGMLEIARYYHEKYGVIIQVIPEDMTIDQLAARIQRAISEARTHYPDAHQIGFIFRSVDDPEDPYGHALPMIWQRENERDHLFFLDTCQYLGGESEPVKRFRAQLLSPTVQLWTVLGTRQIDYSSCYTDALIVLKDALKKPSFREFIAPKIKKSDSSLNAFFLPEELLRTAQVDSYLQKSGADLKKIICWIPEKDRNGKLTGKLQPETLEALKKRNDIAVSWRGLVRLFGFFAVKKGYQFASWLEHRRDLNN